MGCFGKRKVVVQTKRIYFDHNAMSPIRPQVLTAMMKILAQVGNPTLVDWYGRKAHQGLERSKGNNCSII